MLNPISSISPASNSDRANSPPPIRQNLAVLLLQVADELGRVRGDERNRAIHVPGRPREYVVLHSR